MTGAGPCSSRAFIVDDVPALLLYYFAAQLWQRGGGINCAVELPVRAVSVRAGTRPPTWWSFPASPWRCCCCCQPSSSSVTFSRRRPSRPARCALPWQPFTDVSVVSVDWRATTRCLCSEYCLFSTFTEYEERHYDVIRWGEKWRRCCLLRSVHNQLSKTNPISSISISVLGACYWNN